MNDISITRIFDAPLAKVWKVWTEPEYFAQWFGAPLPTVSLDVRPGGAWRATLTTPHGEMPLSGVYREVEPHKRLVWTLEVTGAPDVVTDAALTDLGDRTEVVYRQPGVPEEQCATAEAGVRHILDSFATVLAKS